MGGAMAGAASSGAGQGSSTGSSSYDMFGLMQNYMMKKEEQKWAEEQTKDQREWQEQQLAAMFPFSQQVTDFAMNLFGDGGFGEIENYLTNPTKPTNLERQLYEFFGGTTPSKGRGKTQKHLFDKYGAADSGPLAGKGVPMLEELTGLLQSLVPYAQEWGKPVSEGGGFRVDHQPAEDYALRLMEREMIPELAERFGPPGTGSGARDAYNRMFGDVSSKMGAMQLALDTDAANRRERGFSSGTIQNIFGGPMMANAQFATAGAQAGQMYRNAVDNARPGKGFLAALPMFAQVDQGQGFVQQGYPTSGTDAGNMMSALGQTGPSLAGSIADIFSNWGNGGNNAGSNFNSWDASLGYGGGNDPLSGFTGGDYYYGAGGGDTDLSSVMDSGSFSFA